MKRRTIIRIASFCLALTLAIGGLYLKERKENRLLRQELQNDYSRSLSELNSRLNSISLILEKTLYVTAAPQMSDFAAELYSEAQLAKGALAGLPVGEGSPDTVNRFLSQVGNYALSVSKSVITGSNITDSQRQSLNLLSDTAKKVSQAVTDINITAADPQYFAQELDSQLSGLVPDGALADSLTELEENITDYPTLIYDGPYSDHILTKTPLMLQNAPTVERGEALDIAKKLSGDGTLTFDSNVDGKIESYRFASDICTVEVSRAGGYAVYMRKNRTVGTDRKSVV